MHLSAFLESHHEQIIGEFAAFAETLMPPGPPMSVADLRDHAEELLTAVAIDMRTAQTAAEESRKSQGFGTAQGMGQSGRLHADARIQHGFSLDQVLAEFRALRAAVLRLYEESGGYDLGEVRRFNEAVDEALTVSVKRFAVRTELFRDQFIGMLSHDLRTPLGAITTGAALLALPEDNPERRTRVANRILSSANRMQRLINDLLDLTRARLGGVLPLVRRETDLQQVCQEVISETREANRAASVRLEATGDLSGHWDWDRLAQVVSNLVSNAIQHGAGTPVVLSAAEQGNDVTLTVHNGGAEIPAEALPFVFEPLVRPGEGPNPTHSIGLGLFIARAVVAAHGGHVHAVSSKDAGTTFTVRLPKARP